MVAGISQLEARFLQELRHHLSGLLEKVKRDFSPQQVATELETLKSDSLYSKFQLATEEYVAIRLMGRVSISIGRRLGEIYDKIPRLITQSRFNLSDQDVAPVLDGLHLDIAVPLRSLGREDRDHVLETARSHLALDLSRSSGLGMEIRYNFNPNDSSRLRKDCHMAELLVNEGYVPIYLIYSSISPRDEAIARLRRAGWHFLIGSDAVEFTRTLCGMDFEAILERPIIASEIRNAMQTVMQTIFRSPAFISLATHKPN